MGHPDREIERQTDRQRHKKIERQTDKRQIDRHRRPDRKTQKGSLTARRTDTDIQKDRQTEG